jgi:hypothetical protein
MRRADHPQMVETQGPTAPTVDLRVGIYTPDTTTVDGELAKEPVPIESGKNEIVA